MSKRKARKEIFAINENNTTESEASTPRKEIFSKALQSILGGAAFISALLFSVSWIYNRRYFEVFGIHGYTIRYPPQDYILNAKSVLSVSIFIIFISTIILMHPIAATRKFRLAVSIFCYTTLILVGIYLVRDIWMRFVKYGFDIAAYSTKWMTLMLVIPLLGYGAIAPTYIYKRAITSNQYRQFSQFVSWSGFTAIATLMILVTANYVGKLEGRLDASTHSRLLLINIATERPLGFGIAPDEVINNPAQQPLYVYRNLRYLTQFEGVIYAFKPDQDITFPMVHVIPIEVGYIISVGPNTQNMNPVFLENSVPPTGTLQP